MLSSFLGLGSEKNECDYLYFFPKVVQCLAILGVGTGIRGWSGEIGPLSAPSCLKGGGSSGSRSGLGGAEVPMDMKQLAL